MQKCKMQKYTKNTWPDIAPRFGSIHSILYRSHSHPTTNRRSNNTIEMANVRRPTLLILLFSLVKLTCAYIRGHYICDLKL